MYWLQIPQHKGWIKWNIKKTLNIHTGCSPQHRMMTKTIKLQVAFTAHLRVLISHHPFSHFIRLCYFRPLVHENHDADLKDNETLTVSQSKKNLNTWKKLFAGWGGNTRTGHRKKKRQREDWCDPGMSFLSWPQMRGREKEGKGITVKDREEQQDRSSVCWTWIPNQQAC